MDEIVCDIFHWVPENDCKNSPQTDSQIQSSSQSDKSDVYYTFQDSNFEVTILDNRNSKKNNFINKIKDVFTSDKSDDLDQDNLDDNEWNCNHIPNSIENSEGTCVCKP